MNDVFLAQKNALIFHFNFILMSGEQIQNEARKNEIPLFRRRPDDVEKLYFDEVFLCNLYITSPNLTFKFYQLNYS